MPRTRLQTVPPLSLADLARTDAGLWRLKLRLDRQVVAVERCDLAPGYCLLGRPPRELLRAIDRLRGRLRIGTVAAGMVLRPRPPGSPSQPRGGPRYGRASDTGGAGSAR
jgi:hypothetical protein